jgi:ABC-type lipoprotein release transport system permease subunit
MKLAFQLAYRNLMGAGLRTWLNVGILSFAFLLIIFINGLLDGWNQMAVRDTVAWEFGHGQLAHEDYDPYDPFTIQDGHGPAPADPNLTPILIRQASLYPNGRMLPVMLKGIPKEQTTLSLPTAQLSDADADLPALIGKRMANANNFAVGDEILLRWRDKNGTFDARPLTITAIFDTDVPTIDNGQIWLPLKNLYEMTGLNGEASLMVASKGYAGGPQTGFIWKDQKTLLKNISDLIATKKAGSSIMYLMLLGLALLAIFDTQVLSVFRRQREIGTYVALGMTRKQVVGIFTVEGSMYSLLAAGVATIIGVPLFIWVAKVGVPMGVNADQDFGLAIAARIFPVFGVGLVVGTIILVVLAATIVSFLPARRIANLDPVAALKGKMV